MAIRTGGDGHSSIFCLILCSRKDDKEVIRHVYMDCPCRCLTVVWLQLLGEVLPHLKNMDCQT